MTLGKFDENRMKLDHHEKCYLNSLSFFIHPETQID